MNLIGKVLKERYKITEEVAEGGMAIVYKGTDLLLVRTVAVKVLKDKFARDKSILERFYREARSAAGLSHPNIVSIYDIGREEDIYFIIMEFMSSGTMEDLIKQIGPLSSSEVIKYAIQIAQALDYSHQKKVIHRDIKPQNIMLTEENYVKVVDFGIARAFDEKEITQDGVIMGSAYYFSPEQASGKVATEVSDVYSFGVLLYHMATGVLPFTGDSLLDLANKHLNDLPKLPSEINPEIPIELDTIIIKAMEKEPGERYKSALEMLNSLKASARLFDDIDYQEFENQDSFSEPSEAKADTDSQFFSEEYERHLQENFESGKDEDEDVIITLDDLKKRKRYQKKGSLIPVILIPLILLIILIVGILGFISKLNKPKDDNFLVLVPNIKGRTEKQAVEILEDAGLIFGNISRSYNYDYPEGVIINQEPSFGQNIKRGSKVSVEISNGPQKVIVPNIIQKSLSGAKEDLSKKGLEILVVKEEVHDKLEPNYIISQEPPAGTEVDGKSTVNVIISKGKEGIKLPDIIGMSKDEAESVLFSQNLKLTILKEEYNKEIQKGLIAFQYPSPGTILEKNTIVKVILSLGPPAESKVTRVPEFLSKSLNEARNIAQKLGLNISVQSDEQNTGDDMIVYFQFPQSGDVVKPGEKVIIKVKSKVTVVEVPDVRGKLLMDAKNALRYKGLNIGEVTEKFSKDIIPGKVIQQHPLPKTLLSTGSSVSLTIAKASGKNIVTVPDVVGMSLDKARASIQQNGLKVGDVILQPSSERTGMVISMDPSAGISVEKGENINLIVSK